MAQKIGSLQADLKLESAAFLRDLKKASDATARSTSAMQRHMAGLQKSFASVGNSFKGFIAGFVTVAAVRQLANLGRQAIDTADDIGAAAQKIGISGEELQRFRFAAEQADVSTGDLDNALRLFQKNLATGKISAEGNNLAEAFKNYIAQIAAAPTALEKVRIAQEAAGKQFQSLLLLAQQGPEAFDKWFNSAFVRSEGLLNLASDLDNQFRALNNAISVGFDVGFLEGFGEAMGTTKTDLEALNKSAKEFGNFIGKSVGLAIQNFTALDNWLEQNLPEWLKNMLKGISGTGGPVMLPPLEFEKMFPKAPPALPGDDGELGVGIDKQKEEAAAKKETAAAQRELNATVQDGISLAQQTLSPMEEYRMKLADLKTALDAGKISAEQMGVAQVQAAATAVSPWLNVASTVGGALGQLFEDNKGIAIAQAVINTAQGITAALAQYPPPLSFAMAAAQAAAGAAQIATIKSTKPSTSATRPSVSAGSGAAASGGGSSGSSGAVPALEKSLVLNIHGKGLLSQEQLEGVLDQIRQAQKDGFRLA
jgi:hypothetical protein